MQAYRNAGNTLLRASRRYKAPTPAYQRHASFRPLDWVKEKLAPGIKEAQEEEEVQAARDQAKKDGTVNMFEDIETVTPPAPKESRTRGVQRPQDKKTRPESHKYSTANFKISHRKLNMLGRQISGKPIDYAILQMQFSEKRASARIMNMLATARDHAARYKRLQQGKLVVAEAWVTKGVRPPKRIEPRGRGHYGTRTHPHSKLSVVLKEGKTLEQDKAEAKKRKLKKIVSAALVREDKPIRNPSPTWGW